MENIINLVFQLAAIIFAVRIFGRLATKVGIPSVLGELLSGIIIGPFVLGKIPFVGFPNGFFAGGVSPELEAFSQIASIILLFASGLETDLGLFIKYSVSGGIIGLGGVVVSFVLGDVSAMFIIRALTGEMGNFADPACLFLG